MSSSCGSNGKRSSASSAATASSPASSASRSGSEMIPRAASMRACARDCAMSCGHSRRSKEIDALSRWKSGCWGSEKRDTGGSLCGGAREDRLQLGGDALDLALAHLREERQRDRPPGDVLADRELSLAVPEALAVVAHQVDRRPGGLAVDAGRG